MRVWIADQLERIGNYIGPSNSKPFCQQVRAKRRDSIKKWRKIGMGIVEVGEAEGGYYDP